VAQRQNQNSTLANPRNGTQVQQTADSRLQFKVRATLST